MTVDMWSEPQQLSARNPEGRSRGGRVEAVPAPDPCRHNMSEPDPGTRGRPSTTRAVVWTLAARQGERLLGVLSISILARLLSPSDFGLVAMGTSIAAVAEVLAAFGFDWALVRLPNPTREHYDTAWSLRVLCGALVFVGLAVLAYPIAVLYSRPAVTAVVIAMGFSSLIGSAENIWMAEFRRQNRFESGIQAAHTRQDSWLPHRNCGGAANSLLLGAGRGNHCNPFDLDGAQLPASSA